MAKKTKEAKKTKTAAKKTSIITSIKKVPAAKKAAPKKPAVKKTVAKKVAPKKPTPKAKTKAPKNVVPTKMNEGELEPEDIQDVLTEEEELLLAEQEKKRAQRKKKIAKLEKKIKKLGSDANRSLSKYLQEISRFEPLLPAREVELAIAVKQGNRLALKELTEANLRFVVSVAKDYQGQGLPLTDLINEGNLGLIKAAERFDETRGFKFISYAVWWIRQSILQALAEQSRIVRLPLNKIGSINKINRAFSDLEQKYGRPPTPEEIAESLDITIEEVKQSIKNNGRHLSMDAPLKDSEDSNNMYEVMSSESSPKPDKELMKESLRREIERSLSTLTPREADVVRLYFGLSGKHPMTLEEIGEKFDLTRERVRQIKEKSIRRLKHTSRSKLLKSYLG